MCTVCEHTSDMVNYTGIKNEVCIEVLCNSNVVVGHYGLTAHI